MLIIRADASEKIGIGHIMRCLALAQYLKQYQCQTLFLSQNLPPLLAQRIIDEGIEVMPLSGKDKDIKQTIQTAKSLNTQWIILDGYHFDAKYQKQLKDAQFKILCFDDYVHCEHYFADLILNQNVSADPTLYSHRESYTELLLGGSYCLLRQEFWQWRDWQREIPIVARKILVTLGGSDPENVTLRVIQALQWVAVEGLEILVVVGGSNPHYGQLQGAAQAMALNLRLVRNAMNMPELMDWADMAIAAGGSTNWELAFMGLPTVVLTLADNQRDIAQKLDQMGVVINLGWHQDVTIGQISSVLQELSGDRLKREIMSQKGRQIVDGNGAKRVVSAMTSMLI